MAATTSESSYLLCNIKFLQRTLQILDLYALVLRLRLETIQFLLRCRLLRVIQRGTTGAWELAQTQLDAQILYDSLPILQSGAQLLRFAACGARRERAA